MSDEADKLLAEAKPSAGRWFEYFENMFGTRPIRKPTSDYEPLHIGFRDTEEITMLDLHQVLNSRLRFMQYYADQGVVPGQLDSIELEQMKGRIKELTDIIELLKANDIMGLVREVIPEVI